MGRSVGGILDATSNSTALVTGNAGIMADGRAAIEADVDSFRRTYETNLFGVLTVTNALLPALRRSAKPRIVNISSGTGSPASPVTASR